MERLFPADNTENLKNKGNYKFPRKDADFDRSQIRKPHGAGVGRYKDSVARNLAFVYLAKKMLSKVALDIINRGISQI